LLCSSDGSLETMSRLEIVFSLSWSWSYCVGVVSRLRVQEDT